MEFSSTVEILLVEDNEDDSILISEVFADARLVTVINRVRDGEEGLAYLRREGSYRNARRPGLVLLDINMPRMNGIEFLEVLRADPDLTHAIVFVLTTSKSDEDILAAYREHVAGYLLKQRMDSDFLQVVSLLDHYWKIIELPVADK